MVSECKPEWNREAITVFSRLPSLRRLQATPPLQTYLNESTSKALLKSNLYTVPLEHKVDYEVKQTKTDQGDHHDDSDAMKQRLLKIGKKS